MFEFLKALQQNLNTLLDASNFYVALYNILDDSLSLPFYQDENDNFEHISIEKTLASLVIRSKKSFLLSKEQILEKIRLGEIELIGTLSNSWLGTPLILKNKLIGMMAVQSYSSSDAYTNDDIKLMEFLATQVAVLIERKDNEVKLRNALAKAEEGERLKSAFLSNLSHEIRTPMNAIMGFSSLLDLEDISKEEKTSFISLITENGNALLKMIDDLVDIDQSKVWGDKSQKKMVTLIH
jgi:signal transduction histidine kinase